MKLKKKIPNLSQFTVETDVYRNIDKTKIKEFFMKLAFLGAFLKLQLAVEDGEKPE
jgi:hypothetical protein